MASRDPLSNWLYRMITNTREHSEANWAEIITKLLMCGGIIFYCLHGETTEWGYGMVIMACLFSLQAIMEALLLIVQKNKTIQELDSSQSESMEEKNPFTCNIESSETQNANINPSQKNTDLAANRTFIVIDFEYLIQGRQDTPCQLGLVAVIDDVIVERWSTLIYVPAGIEGNLSYGNGITREMVVHAPQFKDVIERIDKLYKGFELVSHNASTEQSVLRKACKLYGIHSWIIDASWHDTCLLMHGKSLSDSCKELGIPLTHHHDALADAEACACVYNKLCGHNIKVPIVRTYNRRKENAPVMPSPMPVKTTRINLIGKNVVVTGTFKSYPSQEERETLKEKLRSVGVNIQQDVRKSTEILIIGDLGTTGWRKCQKAEEQGILILSESDIISYL